MNTFTGNDILSSRNHIKNEKRFGLIGDPIKGSLSPLLFNAGYDGRYAYDLIEGPDFETSYQKFIDGYEGINVTAPFKEQAFRKADVRDATCEKTGAANLLVKKDGGITAYNTDYTGIQMSLLKAAENDRQVWRTALVVGCGGAGKAAAVAVGDLRLKTVLMNRNMERAEEIARRLPEYGFEVRPLDDFRKCFRKADVIIYTLPGKIDAIDSLDGRDFRGGRFSGKRKFILEANYKTPSFGPSVLERMHKANDLAVYISGTEWLLYQAIGGYGIFTGEMPDAEKMRKVLK